MLRQIFRTTPTLGRARHERIDTRIHRRAIVAAMNYKVVDSARLRSTFLRRELCRDLNRKYIKKDRERSLVPDRRMEFRLASGSWNFRRTVFHSLYSLYWLVPVDVSIYVPTSRVRASTGCNVAVAVSQVDKTCTRQLRCQEDRSRNSYALIV